MQKTFTKKLLAW